MLEVSELTGAWRNTDRGESGGVFRLTLRERGEALTARGWGIGDEAPLEWDEVEVRAYAPSRDGERAWAFTCGWDFGFMRTAVAGYTKQGIAIIVTYNAFDDGSGRSPYWTREFFHRDRAGESDDAVPLRAEQPAMSRARDRPPPGMSSQPLDLAPLLGDWAVFEPGGPGVQRVEVSGEGEGPGTAAIRAFDTGASGPADWGEISAPVFARDVTGGPVAGFHALYAREDERVELCGYLNRGLLAIDVPATLAGGDAGSDHYYRTFLHRT